MNYEAWKNLDWYILCIIVIGMALIVTLLIMRIKEANRQIDQLIEIGLAEIDRKKAHTEAFKKLVDPDWIQEEFERGADVMEARNANRLTKPREDAGPPAKVYRPKLRGKLPSPWTPPRP